MTNLTDDQIRTRRAIRQAAKTIPQTSPIPLHLIDLNRLDKAARRQANSEAWRNSPTNANNRTHARHNEISDNYCSPIPLDDQDTSGYSPALLRLRRRVADARNPLYRRLEAAEAILNFELAPGSGHGVDPDLIAAPSYQFLRQVADADDTPDSLVFRALKLLVGIENARLQAKSTAASVSDKIRLNTQLNNAEERLRLIAAGMWPPTSPDWTPPFQWRPAWPGTFPYPPTNPAQLYP